MKPELSYLAHNLVEIDKYRVETCCVIGKCEIKQDSRYTEELYIIQYSASSVYDCI